MMQSRRSASVLLAVAGFTFPATAQLFEDLETARPTAVPVAPATPEEASQPVPGLTSGQDWFERVRGENLSVETASRLSEGTFIIRRPGSIVTVPSGHRVWVPAAETRLPGEGPMLLIPCQTLGRMNSSIADSADQPVLLSGEVFAYHNQNYLLPTAYARAPQPTPESNGQEIEPDSDSPESTDPAANPNTISDNPGIDELLQTLDDSLSDRGLAVPVADSTQAAASHTSKLGSKAVREGTYLTRRRGRLIRGSTGAWTVTFDNDTDSANGPMLPMIVVPCRLLQQLEHRAQRRGDQLTLTISGRVYTYGETNYLVPTLMQVNPRSDIDAQQ